LIANDSQTSILPYSCITEIFPKQKKTLEVVREKFSDIPAEINYDNPNYKVQAGRFKNKINGLKTLDILKQIFPSAFLLKKKTI